LQLNFYFIAHVNVNVINSWSGFEWFPYAIKLAFICQNCPRTVFSGYYDSFFRHCV